MVLWNADPKDWKSDNANEILDYVINSKASGSIILLHESPPVIEALPKIIEYLKQEDLEIVNLK
jgi:peptidoglycan/xylan/chitin deacetylase (PgdA/CDA1 family)